MRRRWERFLSNRLSVAGLGFLVLLVATALVGPGLLERAFGLEPYGLTCDILEPPGPRHPLGCDELGRDVLARLLIGGRISLFVGILVAFLVTVLGLVFGAIAGFFGGSVDNLLMRFTDTMLAMPTFFIVLAAAALLGPSLLNTVIIIGATHWMGTARLIRSEFLSLREREFVTAARASGAGNLRIIGHILRNVTATLTVAATLAVASGVLTESALSFLGLGTQPPDASWGYMLSSAQNYIWVNPLLGVYPGLLVMLTVLAVNFVGEGIRDALDPRLTR
ncbi:MAG: ABC transporter permease [Chloroflexi bacterium]|nr:ABC transporter permease [Chloroflexota bacterium]